MVFDWFFSGFCVVFKGFLMVFEWFSLGFLMFLVVFFFVFDIGKDTV